MKKQTVHHSAQTKRRERLYRAIAILLPFLALAAAEAALRACGYGHDLDAFIPYPQNTEYVVFNPHASNRFFLDPRFAPSGNKELMRAEKAGGTFRIIVLGESTTVGFPYFHNGSFHRWLLYRLLRTYPDSHFEVVNLSLTAVNSYAVRRFAEEAARCEPDAVLIYAGQNEYYGAQGVASSQMLASAPAVVDAMLRMRRSRLVQWATNAYGALRQTPGQAEATRMELMIGDRQIPRGSALYDRGLAQFEYNMDAALRHLAERGIPVFVSSVASNIKDLPPFVSDGADPESDAARLYALGHEALGRGEYERAHDLLTRAKDADLLRFRAPEALNGIVEALCERYGGAHFVDTRRALEARAPHGLLGDELFTDHVHPNLTGYAVMSEAFYGALLASGLLPPAPQGAMSDGELERDMPVSPVDSLAARLRIAQLRAHFPFYDSLYTGRAVPEETTEERLAAALFRREVDWLTAHSALYDDCLRRGMTRAAARVAENTVLEYAEDPVFYEQAAMICGQAGRTADAAFYMGKAFDMQPSFARARYAAVFSLMIDDPERAMPRLDYAVAHNTEGRGM
ncbi:MAG: GDSL-type esterase/lipase family protein, partial [Tannerella sp.]|nr:GDSL-type esterase/lipase family protein [Tannerella sp.]